MKRFAHKCMAHGCNVPVHAILFMCRTHWAMVPASMQAELWSLYRPGQEQDLDLSEPYVRTAEKIIEYVKGD